jgi:hypothetical protein
MDNVDVIPVLLDAGAATNGNGTWSPLEDALAFGAQRAVKLLLERAATQLLRSLLSGTAPASCSGAPRQATLALR